MVVVIVVLLVAVVLVVVLGQVEPIFGLCGPMLGVLCATYVDILLRFDFFCPPSPRPKPR